jgi:D-amino-acid dehydrogenase
MKNVAILGGGIIGLSTAYYLQKAGGRHSACQVTIFDKSDLSDGCSYGNAGMIVPSHIVPLAAPGMMAKGFRWMLSPTSPFYVKPRLSGDLIKWGYYFWKNATESHVQKSIPVLRDLSFLSKQLYQDLAKEIDFSWQERGLLMLYKTANAEHEMAEEAQLANRAGVEAHQISGQEVQGMETEVKTDVRGAVYYPGDAHINPNQLIKNLLGYLKKNQVTIIDQVSTLKINPKNTTITTEKGQFNFDEIVVASGAWSAEVLKDLGVSLPLQGGKGYSFMLNEVQRNIKIPAIMLEARATATPMNQNLRFAGTMEIAGTDLSVNMNRVKGIVNAINQYYPEIEVVTPQPEAVWRGLRPCSPDGLPYIGRLKNHKNITIATGHGMMGISLGPATGKLVSQIILGEKTEMRIEAFEVGRF